MGLLLPLRMIMVFPEMAVQFLFPHFAQESRQMFRLAMVEIQILHQLVMGKKTHLRQVGNMFCSWPIVVLCLDMGEDNFSVLFFFT